MAATRVAAAPKSLACLARGCFSLVAKSNVLSMAELMISQIKTRAIANDIKSHSLSIKSKYSPKLIAQIVATICIQELCSDLKKCAKPSKANLKLLILSLIENFLFFFNFQCFHHGRCDH